MFHEIGERFPLQNILKNGDIISQQQFTQLILEQEGINSLTLLTMAYMTPRGDGGSVAKVHQQLLKLADQGTKVHVGIDHNYAHFIAPHSDFPNGLAPLFMDRREIRVERQKKTYLYQDLASHPNIELVFHGQGQVPFRKFDHRKILRVKGSPIQDFAVIYGFNMDETLDHDVDTGIYITDSQVLEWVDLQQAKLPTSQPEKASFTDFAFITREATKKGNSLADEEIHGVIQGAEKTLLFCGQFIPNGQLLKDLIDAAEREVEITIISNGASPSRQPMYMLLRKFAERKLTKTAATRANIQFFTSDDPTKFVHIKALIADIGILSKARAITGTDNMANPTKGYVKTREILVELLNDDYINNLYNYIRNNVLPSLRRAEC